MIEIINFKGKQYPKFQTTGFAAQYCFPFAKQVCKGIGVDVGCNRLEWCFKGAIPIDVSIDDKYHAMDLPDALDYVFSSHCLEHLIDWVEVLNYWTSKLKSGGVLFLYLPHYSQEYWRPFNNRKHVNALSPKLIKDCLKSSGQYINIFTSKKDLYNSFMVMAEKI